MSAFGSRARIFIPVFGIACAASLAYVYSRPAVYQSTARLQIEAPPASARLQVDTGARASEKAEDSPNLLNAAQALTSLGLLEKVAARAAGGPGAAYPLEALQQMLVAAPLPGTNVIELRAEGNEREALPRILDAWIDIFRQTSAEAQDRSSSTALTDMRRMVEELKQGVAAKRAELDATRRKSDIVSLEREENQAMARLKGLNASANEARAREVNAEARLNALRENVAAGKPLNLPGDKALIAGLEQRAIDLREKMKEFENDFTPQYLAIDNKYKALRQNLTRLEQQIARERQQSTQQALQSAEEDLASARQAVARLQAELASRKKEAQDFSARFAEHAAAAGELKRLEESYALNRDRLARLEAEKKGTTPRTTILSTPSLPDSPLRPDYTRDAAIGVGGSGLLGLLAVWFFEFFRRSGVPLPVAPSQPIIQIAVAPGELPRAAAPAALGMRAPLLADNSARLPRELSGDEVKSMWVAASHDARLVVAALLGGWTLEDLAALHYEDIDAAAGQARLQHSPARPRPVREPLAQLLQERGAAGRPGSPLAGADGAPPEIADLEVLITCAACDAGLAYCAEVNADVLRHTYLAYLVRQGVRLADIGSIGAGVAPAMLREYGRLSPPGPGRPIESIDPVYPALRMQAG